MAAGWAEGWGRDLVAFAFEGWRDLFEKIEVFLGDFEGGLAFGASFCDGGGVGHFFRLGCRNVTTFTGQEWLTFGRGYGLICISLIALIAVNRTGCFWWIGCFDLGRAFVAGAIVEKSWVSFVCAFCVAAVEAFFGDGEGKLFVEFEFGFCYAEVFVARGAGEGFFQDALWGVCDSGWGFISLGFAGFFTFGPFVSAA